jgi:ribosomal protein S8
MDSISNFVSILNQALKTNKTILFVPNNRINFLICSLLYKENLIYLYQLNYSTNKIKIYLNKLDDQFIFTKISRISKPSKRVYYKGEELRRKVVKEGRFYILSTSMGIVTSNEAIKNNIFGEVIMEIFF